MNDLIRDVPNPQRTRRHVILARHDIESQEHSWPRAVTLASSTQSGQPPGGHVSKIFFLLR